MCLSNFRYIRPWIVHRYGMCITQTRELEVRVVTGDPVVMVALVVTAEQEVRVVTGDPVVMVVLVATVEREVRVVTEEPAVQSEVSAQIAGVKSTGLRRDGTGHPPEAPSPESRAAIATGTACGLSALRQPGSAARMGAVFLPW